jgi:hypothetical protein
MCQNSVYEAPLQLFVHTICQLIEQVKQNAEYCRDVIPESDNQLKTAFLSAEETAALLQSQLEQIVRDLGSKEIGRTPQTTITYYE